MTNAESQITRLATFLIEEGEIAHEVGESQAGFAVRIQESPVAYAIELIKEQKAKIRKLEDDYLGEIGHVLERWATGN